MRRMRDGRSVATLGAMAAITAVDVAASVALTQERARTGEGTATSQPVRKAITIGMPRHAMYDFWRQLTNLPRFMRHLESVEDLGGGRSRWTATAPLGGEVSWEAEITDDVPGERIAWRSLPGAAVRHEGVVRFLDAPGDRGTEVHVELTYEPPAGALGAAVAKLQNAAPDQQIGEDLVRLKQVLETGDVVVSEAVLDGRRIRQRPAQAQTPAATASAGQEV
jgi:uncharacterized membrane protein